MKKFVLLLVMTLLGLSCFSQISPILSPLKGDKAYTVGQVYRFANNKQSPRAREWKKLITKKVTILLSDTLQITNSDEDFEWLFKYISLEEIKLKSGTYKNSGWNESTQKIEPTKKPLKWKGFAGVFSCGSYQTILWKGDCANPLTINEEEQKIAQRGLKRNADTITTDTTGVGGYMNPLKKQNKKLHIKKSGHISDSIINTITINNYYYDDYPRLGWYGYGSAGYYVNAGYSLGWSSYYPYGWYGWGYPTYYSEWLLGFGFGWSTYSGWGWNHPYWNNERWYHDYDYTYHRDDYYHYRDHSHSHNHRIIDDQGNVCGGEDKNKNYFGQNSNRDKRNYSPIAVKQPLAKQQIPQTQKTPKQWQMSENQMSQKQTIQNQVVSQTQMSQRNNNFVSSRSNPARSNNLVSNKSTSSSGSSISRQANQPRNNNFISSRSNPVRSNNVVFNRSNQVTQRQNMSQRQQMSQRQSVPQRQMSSQRQMVQRQAMPQRQQMSQRQSVPQRQSVAMNNNRPSQSSFSRGGNIGRR